MYDKNSRVCAKVDLSAIEYNLKAMKNNIPEGVKIMAVIKTDAYGHGALRIARFLEDKDYIFNPHFEIVTKILSSTQIILLFIQIA